MVCTAKLYTLPCTYFNLCNVIHFKSPFKSAFLVLLIPKAQHIYTALSVHFKQGSNSAIQPTTVPPRSMVVEW